MCYYNMAILCNGVLAGLITEDCFMQVLEYVIGAIILVLSLVVVFAIILQQGRRSGINGAISGGADTFLSKNKARTVDAVLARWTKILVIVFFVLAIVANFIALKK